MPPHEDKVVIEPPIKIPQNMDEERVVTEHPMQENVDGEIRLRRPMRIKTLSISSDYVVS